MSDASPDPLRARVAELEAQCAALISANERLERELGLRNLLDDAELSTPARLVAGWIVRLSYGRGRVSVRVPFQQRLGELCGIGKTHIKGALSELIDVARIVQLHPDGERYELLPDASEWKTRPRCRFGAKHAAAIAAEIDDHNAGEQRDLGELEMTFQPDPITTAAGEGSRERAFGETVSCPPEPGDAGGLPEQSPPGIISATVGGARLSEMVRRQLTAGAAEKKVTNLVTPAPSSHRAAEPPPQKVTKSGTFSAPPTSPAAKKLPNRELSGGPRARASDDFSLSQSSGKSKRQLSSASSEGAADEPDDGFGHRKAKADDGLVLDIRRALGEDQFAGWEDSWRYYVAHSRRAAYHALAALKNHVGPKKPGAYAAHCFKVECRRLGKPFREIALKPLEEQAQ